MSGASKGAVILLLLLHLASSAWPLEAILKNYEDNFLITDRYSPWEPTCWARIKNISGWHRDRVTLIVEPYDLEDRKMPPQAIEIGLKGIGAEENFRWHPPLRMKRYQYIVKGN